MRMVKMTYWLSIFILIMAVDVPQSSPKNSTLFSN